MSELKALLGYCDQIAAISYQIDTLGIIAEIMVVDGVLSLPRFNQKVSMYELIK